MTNKLYDASQQLRWRLSQLEAQLDRVRRRGGDPRIEDRLLEEIERYKQAMSYVR